MEASEADSTTSRDGGGSDQQHQPASNSGATSALERAESLKAEGNKHFQKGEIVEAQRTYTAALSALPKATATKATVTGGNDSDDSAKGQAATLGILRATLLSNRAACHLNRGFKKEDDIESSELHQCVEDCTVAFSLLENVSPSTSQASAVEGLRGKILYRRARANFLLDELNPAAQDLLTALSIDHSNTAASNLLRAVKAKHELRRADNSPLARALAELRTGWDEDGGGGGEGGESKAIDYNRLLRDLKIVFSLVSQDTPSASMELGRRGGVPLLLRIATDDGSHSVGGDGDDAIDDEDRARHRTLALQIVSCACAHKPFVKTYAVLPHLDQSELSTLAIDCCRSDSANEHAFQPDVAVAAIALLLRMVVALNEDDSSSVDGQGATSLVDGANICRVCIAALKCPAMGPQMAALDLVTTWTSSDWDSVALAATETLSESAKQKAKKKVTKSDLHQMSPKQFAAHRKREYELMQQHKERSKRNSLLFLGSETGGLSSLLSCAATTDDTRHHRAIIVVTGKLMTNVEDEAEVKGLVGPFLGCHDGGVIIEEIHDESEEKTEDPINESRKALDECLRKGQLTAALFVSKEELGTWALEEGWSDGRGLHELKELIDSRDDRAMFIASEIVASAASTEKGRSLLASVLQDGSLDVLLESDNVDVSSGAASAVAKLGLASKALSKSEGDMMGMLQLAVDLLNDDGADDARDATSTTSIERGIEVLSYLTSKTNVKEELAHGFRSPTSNSTALERLVELASIPDAGRSMSALGIASIFALMSVSIETLRREAFADKDITPEQYDQLQSLGKTQEEKEELSKEMECDSQEAVGARIRKMGACNVPRAMVKLMEGASEGTQEQLVVAMSRMAVEPSVRGIMIQQGCLSACISVEKGDIENETDTQKKVIQQARHCIAKMMVTTNPGILTAAQRMGSVKPLIQLVKEHESTDLARFEALLSLTNLASAGDETKNRIIAEKGISVVSYAMFSEHDMVRRAATECMSNLLPHPDMLSHLRNPEKLKLFAAFASDFEENFQCARAAAGCLAMASQDDQIAQALTELPHFKDMVRLLLECGNFELMHRVMVVILNMLEHGGKPKQAIIETGAVAFCRAYVESFGGEGNNTDLSPKEKREMAVTLDMARDIVANSG